MARKNRRTDAGWVLGVFFGVVGILIAALLTKKAPEVLQTIQCPNCRAYQQVPNWVTELDCDECDHEIPRTRYDVEPEAI